MSQISEDIIIRFINNTCTDDELMAVKAWIEESEENSRSLFELERIATLSASMRDDRHTENRLREEIRRRIALDRLQTTRHRRSVLFKRIAGIAALFVLCIGIGFMFFHDNRSQMIYVSSEGESMSVLLPDSSVVFLNKNSRLGYPEKFASDCRNVELEGEGFFEVSHDEHRPFTVAGRHLSVKVLGTIFNFASKDTISNSVSLLEGSVEVLTDRQAEGVVLEPGQKAIYSVASGHLTVQDANVAIDAVWHDRLIPFENANIAEIAEILYQLYDVAIDLDNSLDLSKTYSGVTLYHEDIDSTLTRLTHTLPIRYTDKGGRIVISPK